MLAKVLSGTTVGVDAIPITVEVDIASAGLPTFTIVGLADRAVEEAKERVRSAIRNTGADLPPKKIIINLAPADIPKIGPIFDLSIAVGILLGSGQINKDLAKTLVIGELSLDGGLRSVNGVLPLVMMARQLQLDQVLVPFENSQEAAIVQGIKVYAFKNLLEVFQFLSDQQPFLPIEYISPPESVEPVYEYDFGQIKGQEQARRALEIAAAGGHNILLKGPPGAGKTLLARSFPSILPLLSLEESLEVTKIYSISGNLAKHSPVLITRPFRAPHHSASYVGIIGGGNTIRPGEVSLAHRGVLFLDEFPEFSRQVMEALRQPLEDKQVVISRATGSLTFPAQFTLVATQNPCPCGYFGSTQKPCLCAPGQVIKYRKRVSGPLLDRIDIHLDVPAVDVEKLTTDLLVQDSKTIRLRVEKARLKQAERFANLKALTNSEMTNSQIKQFCLLEEEAMSLLKQAVIKMHLSARVYHRILKLSRTIADLANSEIIKTDHLAESLQYRAKEEV